MSSTKWLPRAAVVMVTAFASTGFFAESAFAATATGVAKVSGTTVQFTAAAGATNSVTVTLSGRTVTIDDRVAIRPGAGCKAVKGDRTRVRCTPAKRVKTVKAALGDKNDRFVNKTTGSYRLTATVYGGAGDDTLTANAAAGAFHGEAGNDKLYGGAARDQLSGGAGNDVIAGGAGNDGLYGGDGNDWMSGALGNDTLHAGAGTDTISYAYTRSDASIHLARGKTWADTGPAHGHRLEYDTFFGFENVIGGSGDNWIWGGDGRNVIDAGAGQDSVLAGGGDDVIHGGGGSDFALRGEAGNDVVHGGSGDDFIGGDEGDDVLHGQAGSDRIKGGDGTDELWGGDGADELFGDLGADRLHGSSGDDSLWSEPAGSDSGSEWLSAGDNSDSRQGDLCYVPPTGRHHVQDCENMVTAPPAER